MNKWLWLGIALGMLGTLKWAEASELYRCPGNVYQDKPGARCVRVAERISIIPSPRAQHDAERATIAAEREVIADKAYAPPPPPLPTPRHQDDEDAPFSE